jgi:hypothetical protein
VEAVGQVADLVEPSRELVDRSLEHRVGVGRCGAHASEAQQCGGQPLLRAVVEVAAVERHVQAVFQKLELPDTEDDNRRVLAVLALLGH